MNNPKTDPFTFSVDTEEVQPEIRLDAESLAASAQFEGVEPPKAPEDCDNDADTADIGFGEEPETKQDFESFTEYLTRHVKKLRDTGVRIADMALQRIAADPEEDKTLVKKIADSVVSMIPIAGTWKGVADARALAALARKQKNESLMMDAKVRCLIECAQLQIDILTAGTGRLAAKGTTKIAPKVLQALVAFKAASSAPDFDKYSRPVCESLLKYGRINSAIEKMLAEAPEASSSE